MNWWTDNIKIRDFIVFGDNLILITTNKIYFIPYSYDGSTIRNNLGLRELLILPTSSYETTKILFNEGERCFYIMQLEKWNMTGTNRYFLLPKIYKFDPKEYTIKEIINVFDCAYRDKYEANGLDREQLFSIYLQTKK